MDARDVWPRHDLLLEIRGSSGEGSINKGGHFQSDLVVIEAPVKDEARFPHLHGQWADFDFDFGTVLFLIGGLMMGASGCGRDVVISTDPGIKAGGTIAGIVRATEGSVPLVTRKVTVIHASTGARFETTSSRCAGKGPKQGMS